jgi:hypothetical protein
VTSAFAYLVSPAALLSQGDDPNSAFAMADDGAPDPKGHSDGHQLVVDPLSPLNQVGRALFDALVNSVATTIDFSIDRFGEAAEHIRDAQAAGQPDVVTIDRAGADANREASTGGLQTVPGKQLDEYPPAMFREGGAGASVRPINPSENMSAGAYLGNMLRGFPNGARVRIRVTD